VQNKRKAPYLFYLQNGFNIFELKNKSDLV